MADTPQTNTVIQTVINYLSDQIRLHGLSFFLLGVAVWYFHGQNEVMKAEVRACNDTIIQMYATNQAKLMEALNNNTEALRANTYSNIK